MSPEAKKPIGTATYGEHLCATDASTAALEYLMRQYVGAGLRSGDRVLYVCEPERTATVSGGLGIDVAAFIATRQLVFEDARHMYLEDGAFSVQRTVDYYDAAIVMAVADGFPGLRVAAESNWLVRSSIPGIEHYREYEAGLATLLKARRAIGLCRYDRDVTEHETIRAVVALHSAITIPDPLYADGTVRIERAFEPDGLIISGELTEASRMALHRALEELRSSSDGPVRIDVADVKSLDERWLDELIAFVRRAEPNRTVEVRVRSDDGVRS